MKQAEWEDKIIKTARNLKEAVAMSIAFTWFGNKGEQLCFAVGLMGFDPRIDSLEIVSVPVDEAHAKMVINNFGLEPHRIARLLPLPADRYKPIWFAHWDEDNSDVLIDGAHRYAAAWHKRIPFVKAHKIPESLWREFVVEDMPMRDRDQTVNSFSGIL